MKKSKQMRYASPFWLGISGFSGLISTGRFCSYLPVWKMYTGKVLLQNGMKLLEIEVSEHIWIKVNDAM